MGEQPFHVAIVGGGLCGLSLAIALTKRSISHTIYEARGSFTEIGAGINLGPNTVEAFSLIDANIGDAILAFATRNPGRQKDLWMDVLLGAPTDKFEDARRIHQISTLPLDTGCMTVSRNELLQFLAERIDYKNARFNKKLRDLKQFEENVSLTFEDGTQDTASVVIGCDGAHSTIRRVLLGPENPAAAPQFSKSGVYRAVFPIETFETVVGKEHAGVSTLRLGPGGYVITYPIDGGKNVNVGLWPGHKEVWEHDTWILPNQKPQMLDDMKAWGPTIHKLMSAMSDQTAFWATFHHSAFPDSYFNGRVCIIGDSAHAMAPHQGQGASQSMEDACVMAEVMQAASTATTKTARERIQAALAGYEHVRRPRFEKALSTSGDAFEYWGSLWRPDLSEADIETFGRQADERFPWLWQPDIAGQGKRAIAEMDRLLHP